MTAADGGAGWDEWVDEWVEVEVEEVEECHRCVGGLTAGDDVGAGVGEGGRSNPPRRDACVLAA